MAEDIGTLSAMYRSRKLELYIVLQSLSQLALTLKQQIWSIGNLVCFAISNFEEAYELAQQLFVYEPKTIKVAARSDTQQPIIEPDRGQYLKIANDIQRMTHRECIVRRYESERVLDKYVRWVKKTRETKNMPSEAAINELKELLLQKLCVRVSDALKEVNLRGVKAEKTSPPQI